MKCNRILHRETLQQMLSRTFVAGALRRHREQVLLEREMAMMPATQPHVDAELDRRRQQHQLDELGRQRSELLVQLYAVNRERRQLMRRINVATVRSQDAPRREFVHPCAQPGCRGYLSTAWKCSVCDHFTCADCNAPRGRDRETDGHVCVEADRQSMQTIKADSRRCPNGHFVYRVSGCDQMWCTLCRTAFSWKDGRRINGAHIHNPHFFEYTRDRTGTVAREPGDVPCGGLPTHGELVAACPRDRVRDTRRFDRVLRIFRLVVHVDQVERNQYRDHEINDATNRDLRVAYMLNELDLDALRRMLQRREKRAELRRDLFLVWDMFSNTMSDLFRQCVLDPQRMSAEEGNICDEMEALIRYANGAFAHISQRYACVAPVILGGLQLARVRSTAPPPPTPT